MNQAAEQQKVTKATHNDIVNELKDKAAKDKAFYALCEKFTKRERSRGRVTLNSLKQSMDKAGYNFTKGEYENGLRFLAHLGIGKLDFTTTGKFRSLKEIKWTLQSIGNAVVNDKTPVNSNVRPSYKKMPKITEAGKTEPGAILTVIIKGRKFHFPIPREISEEELGFILANLYKTP